MSFRVLWSFPAEHELRSMHWLREAEVDAAVLRFAERGSGTVERVPEQPTLHVLRAGAHRILIRVDMRARTIFVIRLHR
jgi:hypothetical protein